jgi:HSP20 family protein
MAMERRHNGETERERESGTLSRRGESGMSQWEPEREYGLHPIDMFRRYTREMDRMFDRFLENVGGRGMGGGRWPAIEMFERGDQMVVRAELPDMKREDVRVRMVGDRLLIEGERRSERMESDPERQGMRRSEWSYGQFSRELMVPSDVDTTRLRARMQNGVLEITMPFREERRIRDIEIEEEGGMAPRTSGKR